MVNLDNPNRTSTTRRITCRRARDLQQLSLSLSLSLLSLLSPRPPPLCFTPPSHIAHIVIVPVDQVPCRHYPHFPESRHTSATRPVTSAVPCLAATAAFSGPHSLFTPSSQPAHHYRTDGERRTHRPNSGVSIPLSSVEWTSSSWDGRISSLVEWTST